MVLARNAAVFPRARRPVAAGRPAGGGSPLKAAAGDGGPGPVISRTRPPVSRPPRRPRGARPSANPSGPGSPALGLARRRSPPGTRHGARAVLTLLRLRVRPVVVDVRRARARRATGPGDLPGDGHRD